MTTFQTYLLGFMVLVVGLALAAYLLNVDPKWIGVGVVIAVGIGIIAATTHTKPRDPRPPTTPPRY